MRAFPDFRVFIQRLDGHVEPFHIQLLCVADPPTLDDLRTRLEQSALGDVEKDIFFPNWTKSLHVVQSELLADNNVPSLHTIEQHKQTIDTPEKLRSILDNEEASPGTTAIVVQQCRSKRYSRKKEECSAALNTHISPNAPASPQKSLPSPLHQHRRKPLIASKHASSIIVTKPNNNNNNSNTNSNRTTNRTSNNNNLTYGVALNCVSEPFDSRTIMYMEQPQPYLAPMAMMAPPPPPTAVYQPCYPYAPFNVPAYNYMGTPSFITAYQPFYTY